MFNEYCLFIFETLACSYLPSNQILQLRSPMTAFSLPPLEAKMRSLEKGQMKLRNRLFATKVF